MVVWFTFCCWSHLSCVFNSWSWQGVIDSTLCIYHMVVWFTCCCWSHWSCGFNSWSWQGVIDSTFCDEQDKVLPVACDRLVVFFPHTQSSLESFESWSWRGVLDTTLCDKVCHWLLTGPSIFPGTPVSSTNTVVLKDMGKYKEVFCNGMLSLVLWWNVRNTNW